MEAQVIKRIISRKNYDKYNIPNSFGEEAELIIIPYVKEEFDNDIRTESWYVMKAQEVSGSVNMLNEPEEEAWSEL